MFGHFSFATEDPIDDRGMDWREGQIRAITCLRPSVASHIVSYAYLGVASGTIIIGRVADNATVSTLPTAG